MVHDAARGGYEQHSEAYVRARPTYHPDLVERFVTRFADGTVVDLGAGTGIFTGQLIAAGSCPTAIEPVAAMRHQLATSHPQVRVIDGTAEATGLESQSADTVVIAQAFHWFDHVAALAEIRRILRPGGHLVCVWNVRDESTSWVKTYTDIVDRYGADAPRHRTLDWRRAIDSHASFVAVDDWSVSNPKRVTPEDVVDRALSTSFIAALDAPTQRLALDEVRALAQHQGTEFDFPYRSELQAWRAI